MGQPINMRRALKVVLELAWRLRPHSEVAAEEDFDGFSFTGDDDSRLASRRGSVGGIVKAALLQLFSFSQRTDAATQEAITDARLRRKTNSHSDAAGFLAALGETFQSASRSK